MNRIDHVSTEIENVLVEWNIDEWRGQLADARALAHELDHEAIIEGRKCE
jgi:hypothetical protein